MPLTAMQEEIFAAAIFSGSTRLLTCAARVGILHCMRDIIDLWPTVAALARDLSVNRYTVQAWKNRGSIPGEFDVRIVQAAAERGIEITYEQLAVARSRRLDDETPAEGSMPVC